MSLPLLFLWSCSEKIDTRTPEEKWKDRCEQAGNQMIITFAEKMWQEKGLEPFGAGGGGDGTRTRMLDVIFRCYREVDLSEARKMLIECVQEFLSEINKNQEFASCFTVFPFTYKNINIKIFFYKKSGNYELVNEPFIAVAKAYEGQLKYEVERGEDFETIKKESYEEAVQLTD